MPDYESYDGERFFVRRPIPDQAYGDTGPVYLPTDGDFNVAVSLGGATQVIVEATLSSQDFVSEGAAIWFELFAVTADDAYPIAGPVTAVRAKAAGSGATLEVRQ